MPELLLYSGGIDSTALAFWRRPHTCLTIDYGQRPAEAEVRAARRVCSELGLLHAHIIVPCASIGAGLMTGGAPSPHSVHEEFWPFRNQLLVTIGAMFGLAHGQETIIIGTVATDSRHADGSAGFIDNLDRLLALQEGGLRLSAPAIRMSSIELIRASSIPLHTLAWAHSCHRGSAACGSCPGCHKHSSVAEELGWHR